MLRLIDRTPGDPRLGLAIDEALFEAGRLGGEAAIRFWVNDRAVVIGRSQSAADEVDLVAADELKVPVLRRISGGGAVVHYPGNLNVSVILRATDGLGSVGEVFRAFGEAVASALASRGPVRVEDNALVLDGAKIAGAAQARRGDTILYHTTLLLEPDEIPMNRWLRALRSGYAPHGVASRPRRTTTLSEHAGNAVDVEPIIDAISVAVGQCLGEAIRDAKVGGAVLDRARELRDAKYGEDAWNLAR